MKEHKKTHNPQRLFFYQAIDEWGNIMREYLFWALEDALIQLEKDENDFDSSYIPLFNTKSKFAISLPSPKQLRRLAKRGVELF